VNYNTFRSKGVCKLKLKDLNNIYDKLVPQKQNLIIKRTKVKKDTRLKREEESKKGIVEGLKLPDVVVSSFLYNFHLCFINLVNGKVVKW